MSAYELLKDPVFLEHFDMLIKGYIDKQMIQSGKEAPIPSSLIPLDYNNENLSKAVSRMRKGGEIALFAHDVYLRKKQEQQQ